MRTSSLLQALTFAAVFPSFSFLAGPAVAGCTDPPEPKVNWQRCAFDRENLKGVDLSGARLRDGSFFRTNLSEADLSAVSAFRAKFVNAVLIDARFDKAKLEGADFTKADLSDASFVDADLRRVRLFRATLRGANLTGARMGGADLNQADLSGATWIDGKRTCAEGSIGRCN